MKLDEFEVCLAGPADERGARVDVRSPVGDVEGWLPLGDAERDAMRAWFEGVGDGHWPTRPEPTPEEIGARLFRALFHGPVALAWARTRGHPRGEPQARVQLALRQARPEARLGALLALPWELLYDPEARAFLSGPHVSIVRRVTGAEHTRTPARTPPLHILAAWAQPPGAPPLDLEHETALLKQACQPLRAPRPLRLPGVDAAALEVCAHATLPRLRATLSARRADVLHFMGHGGGETQHGEGWLAFEDETGADPRGRRVRGSLLADNIEDVNLRLVVLNACGPAGPQAGAFRSVAESLVQRGVPAVLTMQAPFTDQAALTFTRAFYGRLLAGEPVDAAVHEARLALRAAEPDAPAWAVPALYLRTPAAALFAPAPWPTRAQAIALALEALVSAWLAFALAFGLGRQSLDSTWDRRYFACSALAAASVLVLRWRLGGLLRWAPPARHRWLRVPAWLAGAALSWSAWK